MPINSPPDCSWQVCCSFPPPPAEKQIAFWRGSPYPFCEPEDKQLNTLCVSVLRPSEPLWMLSSERPKRIVKGIPLDAKGDQKERAKACPWQSLSWTWRVVSSGWTPTGREQCYWGKDLRASRGGFSADGSLRWAVWAVNVAAGLLADVTRISSDYWGNIWLMLRTELAPSTSLHLHLPTDVNKSGSWDYSHVLSVPALINKTAWEQPFLLHCQLIPDPG